MGQVWDAKDYFSPRESGNMKDLKDTPGQKLPSLSASSISRPWLLLRREASLCEGALEETQSTWNSFLPRRGKGRPGRVAREGSGNKASSLL